jgi:hypothetical protein
MPLPAQKEDIMTSYRILVHCLFFTIYFIVASECFAQSGSGTPVKYISSCEIDLNHDNAPDIALLMETMRGRELIVLISRKNGYDAHLVSRGKPDMYLSCHFGKYVKETAASGSKGRLVQTGGTYIKLTLPESSSVVYFWAENRFQEIWVSD